MSEDLKSIALIELTSIASGFAVADAMMKEADVQLILSRTICAGKFMVVIGGEIAAVRSSLDAGLDAFEGAVIDSTLIPRVHSDLFPALAGSNPIETDGGALGILEAFSVASLIEGADAAVKAASVKILEVRLAMALGGKAFATFTGEVAAVTAALDAGALRIGERGLLVNRVVIPSPSPQLYREVL